MLIVVCLIIKDPVCVKEKIQIIKVNDQLLFGHSVKMILVNEQVEILCIVETSAENISKSKVINTAYIVYISSFMLIEVSISLVKNVHT